MTNSVPTDTYSDDFLSIFPALAPEESDISHDDFVRRYLDPLQPVVVRGGVSKWPAVEKWTPQYLRDAIGDKSVSVGTISPVPVEKPIRRAAAVIDEMVDRPIADEKTPYLTQLNVHDVFPELSDDVRPHPHFALPDRLSHPLLMDGLHYPKGQMELLFGGGGLGFPLHFDRGFMHAFIMQIYGEKDVVLIAHEQGRHLYTSETFEAVSGIENIWHPDFDTYPELAKVRGYRATLKPGDLAFIPSGWWHATRLPGISIGTTCNSFSRSNWRRYKQFAIDKRRGTMPAAKLMAWRLYLEAVGAACRISEMVTGR